MKISGNRRLLGVFVLALAVAPKLSLAQPPLDPSLPMSAKVFFSPVGVYLPEAEAVSPVGLNPATLSSPELQLHKLAETDYGIHSLRNGPDFHFGILNYAEAIGNKKGSFRISGYDTRSSTAPIPATAPVSIRQNIQSVEVVYSQVITPHLSLGGALLPVDDARTYLTLNGASVATGKAHSTFQGRVGALWHDPKWRAGLVYGYEKDNSTLSIPGAPDQSARFSQRNLTAGGSYSPKLGTTVFFNRQHTLVDGMGSRSPISVDYWGVQQFLTPQWMAQVARLDRGGSLSVGHYGKDWQIIGSITYRAFSSAEPFYGKGTTTFLSAVHEF